LAVDHAQLTVAAMSSFHMLNEASPAVSPLGIPGVEGRISPISSPLPNMVTRARLDEDAAGSTIERVVERFAAEDKAFGWAVGPDSSPADLADRLQAAGLHKVEQWAGLALTDLDRPIPASAAISIEEVGWQELRDYTDFMARAFGFDVTGEVARVMVEMMEALHDRYGTWAYLTYCDGTDTPIALSFLTGTPHSGVFNLAFAATLQDHRRQGAYSSMVARRVADARRMGAQAIVTQASGETSAPILRKFGFHDLCTLDLYAWTPS
jgi:hypothetical protein